MPEFMSAVWKKISTKPGYRYLLLAAALLVFTVNLLTPARESADQNVREAHVREQSDPQPAPVLIEIIPPASDSIATSEIESAPDPVVTPAEPTERFVVTEDITDPQVPVESAFNLVLIIDDIGYNAEAGRRAISLPGQVTYAVIPYTPHGKMLAESAHLADKEVILHAPMSNLSGMDLGQGGLTLQLSEEEFLQTLRMALADIPHIKGLNNHTGSELTAVVQPMQWVMQELKSRGLYFVDSVTTNSSVAAATAEQYQVPALRRHVFLDNVQTAQAIDSEFQRALSLAEKQGYAVAIGHPYPETLAYLETALPLLAARNIKLISASAMIAQLQTPSAVETTAAW